MTAIPRIKPACAALDFDGTLAYYEGGYALLFGMFLRRGIAEGIIRQAVSKVANLGFTVALLAQELEKETGVPLSKDASLFEEFKAAQTGSLRLYPDSLPVIARLKSAKIPVAVVTFGNPEFQTEKVRHLGIPYDELDTVAPPRSKGEAVTELFKRRGGPLLFVDDTPGQLDSVRDAGLSSSDVITVRIRRADNHHAAESSRYPHCEITTLEELAGSLGI
jgi:phosphoglycolate phosphatase-like HAD superfamily hydrolase